MFDFPIGVLLDSFRTNAETAMKQAAALGLSGIQVYATEGDMAPENMDARRRKEFRAMADAYGLRISALCGDLGYGFFDPARNGQGIERSKRILELAKDLGTDIVTTHIGVVPACPAHPRYAVMQDACGRLAEYADSLDAHFAVETGPEPASVLRDFLDGLHSTGVAVNLDPANLIMTVGGSAAEAVHTLRDYIVHTHAKDGVRHRECDPEILYGIREPEEPFDEAAYCEEVPLGTGGVCWPEYLEALDSIGYRGFLTIEREVGEDPAADIRLAADFLRRLIRQSR
ncbi:MAG: sugar phosphate isomerase/epimerase family protein [Candidatus Merdivicinus sp.]